MSKMKIPKRYTGVAKTAVDPLGLGLGDALFGKSEGPDYSAEEKAQRDALAKGQKATDDFVSGGAAHFDKGKDLEFQSLGPARTLGDTGLGDISTDPRYKEAELAALKDLEEQSQNGFTARDRADMAQTEASVNRANRGRLGAIRQSMQARGMGGSGMDLVAEMQSAQDSAELEALRALETDAQMQERKERATSARGSLASQLQSRDFSQEAEKAAAQDAIDRFNTQNAIAVDQYNNQGRNEASAQNWNRENETSDRNSSAAYDYRKDVLGANQAQAGLNYNAAVEGENRKRMDDAAAEERASGKFGAILGAGGAVVGGVYGGPAGAAAGYQVGSGVGRSVGSNAYRNNAYGSDKRLKENIREEHPLEIEAFLDSIEPKSFDYKEGEKGRHGVLADDLAKSSIGRSIIVEDEGGMKNIKVNDAISALLQAVAHLNKKVK